MEPVSQTAPASVASGGNVDADAARYQLCDASGGAFTLNLPTPGSRIGDPITFKKVDSSANAITLDAGAATIDGAGTFDLSSQWDKITMIDDGSNWLVVG